MPAEPGLTGERLTAGVSCGCAHPTPNRVIPTGACRQLDAGLGKAQTPAPQNATRCP